MRSYYNSNVDPNYAGYTGPIPNYSQKNMRQNLSKYSSGEMRNFNYSTNLGGNIGDNYIDNVNFNDTPCQSIIQAPVMDNYQNTFPSQVIDTQPLNMYIMQQPPNQSCLLPQGNIIYMMPFNTSQMMYPPPQQDPMSHSQILPTNAPSLNSEKEIRDRAIKEKVIAKFAERELDIMHNFQLKVDKFPDYTDDIFGTMKCLLKEKSEALEQIEFERNNAKSIIGDYPMNLDMDMKLLRLIDDIVERKLTKMEEKKNISKPKENIQNYSVNLKENDYNQNLSNEEMKLKCYKTFQDKKKLDLGSLAFKSKYEENDDYGDKDFVNINASVKCKNVYRGKEYEVNKSLKGDSKMIVKNNINKSNASSSSYQTWKPNKSIKDKNSIRQSILSKLESINEDKEEKEEKEIKNKRRQNEDSKSIKSKESKISHQTDNSQKYFQKEESKEEEVNESIEEKSIKSKSSVPSENVNLKTSVKMEENKESKISEEINTKTIKNKTNKSNLKEKNSSQLKSSEKMKNESQGDNFSSTIKNLDFRSQAQSRYEEVNKEQNENIPKESEEINPIKEKKKNNLRVSFKSIKEPTNMSKSLKKEIDLNAIQLSMIYSKDFTTEGKLLPSLYDMLAQPSTYKLGLKKIEMPEKELITSQERRIDVPVVNRILQKRKEEKEKKKKEGGFSCRQVDEIDENKKEK
ncbi:MAG: hypothetical protein MJ252_16245, partial [archaeon]|nr:hypothetical protein [archaeon]